MAGQADADDSPRIRSDRWAALVETMHAFASASSALSPLLDTIVRRTAETVGGFCAVRLLSPDETSLEAITFHDVDEAAAEVIGKLIAGDRIVLSQQPRLASVLMAGAPLLVPALTAEQVRAHFTEPAQAEAAIGLQIGNVAIVPLRAHGRLLGSLSIGRHGTGAPPLDAADLELATMLASHASFAILNARALEVSERLAARLQMLSSAGRDFAQHWDDPSTVLSTVARRVVDLLGDFCSIRLRMEGDELRTVGAYHRDPELVQAVLEGRVEPADARSGITWEAFQSGKSILLPEITMEELLAKTDPRNEWFLRRLGIFSLIAVPLTARGEVMGAMSVIRSRPERFTAEDLSLMEDLAAHAALAISNSRSLAMARNELAERERAEEHVRRIEDQLRQSQKMDAIGRLAGGVAHDFNNLLSVVLSYSELILASVSAEEPLHADVREIQRAGERAADLTKQLLSFSRQQVVEPAVLDLNDSVRSMQRMLSRIVGEDVKVTLGLAPDLGRVRADRGHVDQVLMNLVVNARDAMPDGGSLSIETRNVELDRSFVQEHFGVAPGPYVMLAVSDSGVGMDRATQDRIFEPFFTTKERGKSNGLGLSTVFGIVKQSGGTIWVYSEVGRGTVVKIYLPRTDAPPTAATPTPHPSAVTGTETVLLVEDDDQVRHVVRSILRRAGYRVLEANGGDAAIELAAGHEGTIDVVVCDVVMPGRSGPETVRALLERTPALRVLFVSGYSEEAVTHRGVLSPGRPLLQKPLTPDELLRRLREVLDAPG